MRFGRWPFGSRASTAFAAAAQGVLRDQDPGVVFDHGTTDPGGPLLVSRRGPFLVSDDGRLASAQSFLTAAFASGAARVAERLYGLALAQAQQGGQTAEAAERAALGVYTRAMPAGQTEADIAATRQSYALTVPLDLAEGKLEVPVQTPYHISSRLSFTPAPIVDTPRTT